MVQKFKDVLDKMLDIYKAKNNDYGDSFSKQLDEFGILAGVISLNNKIERLKTLSSGKTAMVKNESIEDTLLDLANYATMTYMWLVNKSDENAESDEYKNGWWEINLDKLFEKKDRTYSNYKSKFQDYMYYINNDIYVRCYVVDRGDGWCTLKLPGDYGFTIKNSEFDSYDMRCVGGVGYNVD